MGSCRGILCGGETSPWLCVGTRPRGLKGSRRQKRRHLQAAASAWRVSRGKTGGRCVYAWAGPGGVGERPREGTRRKKDSGTTGWKRGPVERRRRNSLELSSCWCLPQPSLPERPRPAPAPCSPRPRPDLDGPHQQPSGQPPARYGPSHPAPQLPPRGLSPRPSGFPPAATGFERAG